MAVDPAESAEHHDRQEAEMVAEEVLACQFTSWFPLSLGFTSSLNQAVRKPAM